MAYPTLACKFTALYAPVFGTTVQPAPLQFNQVNVLDTSGTWLATFQCDPELSAFLPAQTIDWLTAEQFAELWPLLITIFVAGFCVRQLLRVFS